MIFKLQLGGPIIPPFVSYTPVTVTGGLAGLETLESKAQGLIDKDMLKLIEKLDSLPSDTTAIIQLLLNFLIEEASGFNTSNMTSKYLQIVGNMSKAKFNRKLYEEAFNIAKTNGGINEVAIDDRGQVFCMNKEGDFKLLSPENIQDSGYVPLTNSELLDYRAYAPSMAYKNSILKVVSNSIGMESVTKMILNSIANLGTTSTTLEGYAKTEATQLLQGLELFMVAARKSNDYNPTLDNLYKGKLLTESLAMLAQQALSYLYRTLPENAKSLLKTKTRNGTDAEAVELVQTLINSKLSPTTNFSLNLDEPTSDSKKKGGTGDNLDVDLVTMILASHGGHDTIYLLNNKFGIGMTVLGTAYELIKDTKGNHIGRTSMENLLNESGLRSIINADNGVYFGNQKVDLDSLLNITYDGKGLLRVNLPIRSDGSPNFSLLEEYSKALAEFLLSSLTNKDRLKIFGDTEKYPNLNSLITSTGELDLSKFAPFIIASGMTTDGMVEIDEKNKFLTEVKLSPELILQLKTSLAVGTGKLTLYPDIDEYDLGEWFLFGLNKYDHIFKGNIYIPLNMNKMAAALGGNQNIDTTTGLILEKEYQRRDMTFLKADPSLLLNN